MPYELEGIAKELTLAVLPKVIVGSNEPEAIGKKYSKLYNTILKEIVAGVKEAHK